VSAVVSEVDARSFHAVRPRLFGIAYRILGSIEEADDVVQDTWIRWQGTDRSKVRNAEAFLATSTMRLALNIAQSARARHETSVDLSLVELVDARADPALGAARGVAAELAVRTLLEKLSPAERAVYLLREAFDYPYRRISLVLAVSEANARQLVTRARARLSSTSGRRVGADDQRRLLEVFVAAARSGNLRALEQFLVADLATRAYGYETIVAADPAIECAA
jgi:RNA polymerase sigma-70 factor (ECF subfamily)